MPEAYVQGHDLDVWRQCRAGQEGALGQVAVRRERSRGSEFGHLRIEIGKKRKRKKGKKVGEKKKKKAKAD
jgi:hypothetical protein